MFSNFAFSAVTVITPRFLSFSVGRKMALGVLACCVALITLAFSSGAGAATVTHANRNDGFGESGFTLTTDWSNAAAPSAGNDYIDQNWDIRTPFNTTTDDTFAGDSLTLTDGGMLIYKGGNVHNVTINNLTIDAGVIRDTANGTGGMTLIGSGIHLSANGGTVYEGRGGNNATTTLGANIDGTGPLAIGGSSNATSPGNMRYVVSGSNNSYTGPTLLMGRTVQLSGTGALPVGANLQFGSAAPFAANGNATLDLNGGIYNVGSLTIASYNSVTASGTLLSPDPSSAAGKIVVHFARLPAGLQIGQNVSQTGATQSDIITGIDYSTNDVILGDTNSATTYVSGTFSFNNTAAGSGTQIVTNTNTATPATLIFAGGSTASVFQDGQINQATGATTNLTVQSGSLTLNRGSNYTGATTLNGGTLALNFNGGANSAGNNIISATSPLVLAGGTLTLAGTSNTSSPNNVQTFASTTVNGSSAVQLTALTNVAHSLELNLGAIARNAGGTLDVTNPTGTLSATNGVVTTSGTSGQLLTDANNVPYATVTSGTTSDWAKIATDGTTKWIAPLVSGDYTASGASSLAGNADVVTNVSTGTYSPTTIRFHDSTARNVAGTISTGAILMDANSGGATMTGSLSTGLSGKDLVIIQKNTTNNLTINSNLTDNGTSSLTKAGAGTAILGGTNSYGGATNVSGGMLEFAKQASLPNNNVTVLNGATLALRVGGASEFTTTDVGTLAGLSGFQSGSALGIDTTSGDVSLGSAISGVNALGITKLGTNVLTLNAANTYTGTTTVSGGTLRLGAAGAGSISSSSPVVVSNGTFDLNNNSATLKSLSGTGGTVALGSGSLTFNKGANATYAGAVTGSGNVTVTGGSRQSFTGTPSYTGNTTVGVGTLSLSSSSSSTVGTSSSTVSIAPASGDVATLNVGAGVTFNANTISVGPYNPAGVDLLTASQSGGAATLTQTGGSIVANTLVLGGAGTLANHAHGTLNLAGGILTVPAVTTAGGTGAQINFSGGTLRATGGGSDPANFIDSNIGGNNLFVAGGGGATIDSNGHTFTMSNNFVHDSTGPATDGGFTKAGNGTLTLSGTSTYTGATTVSGGTLDLSLGAPSTTSGFNVNGTLINHAQLPVTTGKFLFGSGTANGGAALASGSITSAGGATTVGTLTLVNGSLDLNGGTVHFDLSSTGNGSNDKIQANGGLNLNSGIVDISFASTPAANQTFTLFTYSTLGGAISPSQLAVTGNAPRGTTIINDIANSALEIQTGNSTTPAGILTWKATGASPQLWDINTTHNWNNTSSQPNSNDVFFNGDSVQFPNTPAGLAHNVSIPDGVAVAPSPPAATSSDATTAIVVNSDAGNDYTISSPGSGHITGGGGLTKTGTSVLTLKTSNDYTGGTNINNGTLLALDSNSSAPASATGAGLVTVNSTGTLQIGDGLTGGAGTVNGAIVLNGTSTQLVLNRPDSITFSNTVSGTGGVTVTGGATVTTGGTMTYSGNTTITNNTTLQGGGTNTLSPNSTVVFASSTATLSTSGAQAVGGLSSSAGTNGIVNMGGNLTISGPATTNATFNGTLNANGNALTVNGSPSLIQTLTGPVNGYGNQTFVNNGTLNFNLVTDQTLGNPASSVNVGSNAGNNGALGVIGSHVTTFFLNNLNIGSNSGAAAGTGAFVQNGNSLIQVQGVIDIGDNGAGTSSANLSGGTVLSAGDIRLARNGTTGTVGNLTVGAGEAVQVLLVDGVSHFGIVYGQYGFGPAGTITQNGGSITTYQTDTNTPATAGGIYFAHNDRFLGAFTYNLNGGTLTIPTINVDGFDNNATGPSAASVATGELPFNLPVVNFNGGTLRATSNQSDFVTTNFNNSAASTTLPVAAVITTNVQAGGAVIDPNGFSVGFSVNFAHPTALGTTKDGGLTVNDSNGGSGVVILKGASTFNGGLNVVKGTVMAGNAALPAQTISGTVAAASATVTVPSVTGLAVGQTVSGGSLAAGTVIINIPSPTTVVLSSSLAASASLTFGATSPLGVGRLILNGGTLNTGGFNQSLPAVKLKSNSMLDLNAGNSGETFNFGDSSLSHWANGAANGVLTIANWSGTGNPNGSDSDQIVFPSATSLSGNQLSQIQFSGSGSQYAKLVLLTGGPNSGKYELAPSATLPTGIMTLGDVNQDGLVNTKDVSALMSALSDLNGYDAGTAKYSGTSTLIRTSGGTFSAAQLMNVADANLDDVVDSRDIQALIVAIANGGVFGGGGGGGSLTAVPEPATLLLLGIGGVLLAGIHRSRFQGGRKKCQ